MTKQEKITPLSLHSENDFARFYKAYHRRFVRYAFYYVNDEQAAEDMTHDALLYYWENRKGIGEDTDVLGYILLTVKNKCLNYLRHLQVKADYQSRCTQLHPWEVDTRIQTLENEEYGKLFSADIRKILEEAMNEMPQETRRIFVLHRLKDVPRREIAKQLGVSVQKVDYHINKAHAFLAERLKDYLPLVMLLMAS